MLFGLSQHEWVATNGCNYTAPVFRLQPFFSPFFLSLSIIWYSSGISTNQIVIPECIEHAQHSGYLGWFSGPEYCSIFVHIFCLLKDRNEEWRIITCFLIANERYITILPECYLNEWFLGMVHSTTTKWDNYSSIRLRNLRLEANLLRKEGAQTQA